MMLNNIKLYIYKIVGKIARLFLIKEKSKSDLLTKVEKNVFVFWTGDNELTENRKRCLAVLEQKSGVKVTLVTKRDLIEFEHPDYPIHPGYYFLSLNHRSDYLRCYFMHVYGGAYSDIKENLFSWVASFDKLNNSNKWILGYPEIAPSSVASKNKKLRRNYFRLIGNGCFICKPRTPFTEEWFSIVHKLLDNNLEELKKNPGDMWGKNEGYPLRWAEVQGELFHPLLFKYKDEIIHDERMILSFQNYK